MKAVLGQDPGWLQRKAGGGPWKEVGGTSLHLELQEQQQDPMSDGESPRKRKASLNVTEQLAESERAFSGLAVGPGRHMSASSEWFSGIRGRQIGY